MSIAPSRVSFGGAIALAIGVLLTPVPSRAVVCVGDCDGPLFPLVCCQRRCRLEEACDTNGVCQSRFPAP